MKRLHLKALIVGGVVLLTLGVPGCFLARAPITQATLVFSDLVGTVGSQGEVKVSVAQMPGGGMQVLVVGNGATGGLRYDPAQFQVTDVTGLNGFMVLAWGTFDAGGGLLHVRFVVANPTGGAITGDVALIVGNRLGGTDFNFQATSLQLADANADLIAVYNLAVGKAPPYYVKGGN